MRLLLAASIVSVALAQPVYDCRADLVTRWNRFAKDANAYVNGLNEGKVNYGLRKRVESEFGRVKGCECW